MADTAQATEEQAQENQTATEDSKTQVQEVGFPESAESEGASAAGSIDILLDMDVPVTVSIGQADISVKRLLQLGPGSVVKLDKPIEAPADLYLNDSKFATGSVVVVDGRFGVRIKQILGISEAETVESADKPAEA
jgi:flagellar motor switch protein FliN/FliY